MYSLIDTLDLATDDILCSVAYILFSGIQLFRELKQHFI